MSTEPNETQETEATSEQPQVVAEDEAERRKFTRRALRVAATVTLSNAQTFQVRTLDIGLGGMAIVASANPKPGVTFNIRLSVPLGHEAEAFEAKVRVVHSIFSSAESGFKIGLKFVQASQESIAVTTKYIAANA